jgi:hypothetical protein
MAYGNFTKDVWKSNLQNAVKGKDQGGSGWTNQQAWDYGIQNGLTADEAGSVFNDAGLGGSFLQEGIAKNGGGNTGLLAAAKGMQSGGISRENAFAAYQQANPQGTQADFDKWTSDNGVYALPTTKPANTTAPANNFGTTSYSQNDWQAALQNAIKGKDQGGLGWTNQQAYDYGIQNGLTPDQAAQVFVGANQAGAFLKDGVNFYGGGNAGLLGAAKSIQDAGVSKENAFAAYQQANPNGTPADFDKFISENGLFGASPTGTQPKPDVTQPKPDDFTQINKDAGGKPATNAPLDAKTRSSAITEIFGKGGSFEDVTKWAGDNKVSMPDLIQAYLDAGKGGDLFMRAVNSSGEEGVGQWAMDNGISYQQLAASQKQAGGDNKTLDAWLQKHPNIVLSGQPAGLGGNGLKTGGPAKILPGSGANAGNVIGGKDNDVIKLDHNEWGNHTLPPTGGNVSAPTQPPAAGAPVTSGGGTTPTSPSPTTATPSVSTGGGLLGSQMGDTKYALTSDRLGQLTNGATNPIEAQAEGEMAQAVNSRGLLNSTLGQASIQAAGLGAMKDLAQSDVDTYNRAGLQEGQNAFTGRENAANRSLQSSLQNSQQSWQSGENAANRNFQKDESAASRSFQRDENQLSFERNKELSSIQNGFTEKMTQLGYNHADTQSALDRAQQIMVADKNISAQQALQKAQQEFQGSENAASRAQATDQFKAQLAQSGMQFDKNFDLSLQNLSQSKFVDYKNTMLTILNGDYPDTASRQLVLDSASDFYGVPRTKAPTVTGPATTTTTTTTGTNGIAAGEKNGTPDYSKVTEGSNVAATDDTGAEVTGTWVKNPASKSGWAIRLADGSEHEA